MSLNIGFSIFGQHYIRVKSSKCLAFGSGIWATGITHRNYANIRLESPCSFKRLSAVKLNGVAPNLLGPSSVQIPTIRIMSALPVGWLRLQPKNVVKTL